MDSYQAGYIIGRLACLVVPLLLIVGLVVFGVVHLVRKNRPAAPQPYPGQYHPAAPPYPGPPQGPGYPAPPPPDGGSAYPGHRPPSGL